MWNDSWREELERDYYDAFIRLCECRNRKADIPLMSMLMYSYNYKNHSAEECLDRMIEWVVGWNNQDELEISCEDYEKMLKKVLTNSFCM